MPDILLNDVKRDRDALADALSDLLNAKTSEELDEARSTHAAVIAKFCKLTTETGE